MTTIHLPYSKWKPITQNGNLNRCFQATHRENRIYAWSGNATNIFRALIDSDDYSDWSTNFQSGSIEVASENEAVVKLIEASSGGTISANNDISIVGSVSMNSLPQNATGIQMFADNPLALKNNSSPHDTSTIIPDGKTFFIQQIIAGSQGDPSSDGSKIEVFYYNGSEHLIDRVYIVGGTKFGNYPNTSEARDGTVLLGNGSYTIIIRRTRLSNSLQEVDATVRGYVI